MNFVRLSVSLCVLFFAVLASADSDPVMTGINFNRAYVPNGFDSNDQVEIVGAGIFSNSCYRYAETKVDVDQVDKTITLTPSAYMYTGYCLQVLMPFDHSINLGLLKEGTYKVKEALNPEVLGSINVRAATKPEADDYLYAPITQAFFKSQGSSNLVQLSGEFPLSCMKIKNVLFDKQPDVLVVQPIVELDHSVPCKDGKFHFENLSDVGPLTKGNYLLHVRSMNGKSVNTVVTVR